MTQQVERELGQIVFGQPTEEHDLPRFAKSLFVAIVEEWERVWWNQHQESWSDHDTGDLGVLHWRPYTYAETPDAGPNFWLDGQELKIRWYKHPGRGMSCSHEFTPSQWIAWHDAVMTELERVDEAHSER
jgi:hypothetical protein